MGVVDSDGSLKHLESVDVPLPTVKHDMAITERFSLILDFPLTIAPEKLLSGEKPAAFESDKPSRIGVMPRYGKNDDIKWFDVDTSWVFHVLNAYEEGDDVVLQACRTPGTNLTPSAQGEDWSEKSWRYGSIFHNRIYEWRLNMATGEVKEGIIGPYETWPEFPTINPRYVGRKNRFAYCVDYDYRISRVLEAPASPTLVKFTLAPDIAMERHDLGPNRFGEEGTFVPRGGSEAAEDDGWLVTFVYDENIDRSEVRIIDCSNFCGSPVCRLGLPGRVPFGFHGTFVPKQSITT